MFDIGQIKKMNERAALEALQKELQPFVGSAARDVKCTQLPNFGNYRPKHWKLVNVHFVSRRLRRNRPWLKLSQTEKEFKTCVNSQRGYALLEMGEDDLTVGEFQKIS